MRNKLIAAFACTTALVSTGAASAADLGARYTKAPAYVEPLFNWTGFYVGGHIGGAWTNEQFINNGSARRSAISSRVRAIVSAAQASWAVPRSVTTGRPTTTCSAWKARSPA